MIGFEVIVKTIARRVASVVLAADAWLDSAAQTWNRCRRKPVPVPIPVRSRRRMR